MKRILFVKHFQANAKFVTNDIDILKKNYDVTVKSIRTSKGLSSIAALFIQFYYLLFNSLRFDLFYIWFADYHSFLPILFSRIFGKKCITCAGGYEATWIPEINMGVYTSDTLFKRLRRFCVTYSLKHCDYIVPVDESLINNTNDYIYSDKPDRPSLKDGIKHFIPDIKTEFKTIHVGYDSELFKKQEGLQKEKSVICVGFAPNENEIKRKGFDILIQCAEKMKDVRFILIGLDKNFIDKYSELKLNNLEMHGRKTYRELVEYYSRAKVYAQLSLFEGLPSSICEAMLCECVPVGSNVNGILEIIKDTGYIVERKDLNEIEKALSKGLETNDEIGKRARQNIIENFSCQKRESEINKLVSSLLSARGPEHLPAAE